MADLLITIDGPAGSGKSTLAQMLSKRLCAAVLDTGAMYQRGDAGGDAERGGP